MSREAGRLRVLENARRLRHLLEAHDRVELLGLAIAKTDAPTVDATQRSAPESRPRFRTERRLDA
jgi:hypothetical protein